MLIIEHFYRVVFFKTEHSPGLPPAASAPHLPKKTITKKKVTCHQCSKSRGEKGGQACPPFIIHVRLLYVLILEFTREKKEISAILVTGYLTCSYLPQGYSLKGVFRIEWILIIPVHDLQE